MTILLETHDIFVGYLLLDVIENVFYHLFLNSLHGEFEHSITIIPPPVLIVLTITESCLLI